VYFGNLEDDTVTSVTPADVTKGYGLGAGHQQGPSGITAGPDGNVYAADADAQNLIAMINPAAHTVTDFTVPTTGADPWGIAQGPDGNIWFTEASVGKVAMLQLSQT
jgi:virginiamycin B lyase